MSKGYPSMTALLGLLAIAGYQNRDKIAELLKGNQDRTGQASVPPIPNSTQNQGGSGTLDSLAGLFGGIGSAGVGGLIASGLNELVEHFTKGGHGEAAQSWVRQGPNRELAEADLERAIGAETLDHLTQQTGLSRAALLSRLSRELPSAVDRYSPDGRLPV
ncbi:YidB family protein [Methylorubrum aminovorans]|uniref:YidB family protein n=1 Tax=Methylorubrum aminovorans TaxID=269069 RepID=UPI003C2D9873